MRLGIKLAESLGMIPYALCRIQIMMINHATSDYFGDAYDAAIFLGRSNFPMISRFYLFYRNKSLSAAGSSLPRVLDQLIYKVVKETFVGKCYTHMRICQQQDI